MHILTGLDQLSRLRRRNCLGPLIVVKSSNLGEPRTMLIIGGSASTSNAVETDFVVVRTFANPWQVLTDTQITGEDHWMIPANIKQ